MVFESLLYRRVARLVVRLSLPMLGLAWSGAAQAGPPAARRVGRGLGPADDFRTLAAQRPRRCPGEPAGGVAAAGWQAEASQCGWQDLLRVRRWRGPGTGAPNDCVSPLARWWAWARRDNGASTAWRAGWTSHSIADARGDQQRLVILRRHDDGQWSVTEWRWTPSSRAATRRWQAGRWQALVARADALRQHAAASDGLAALLEANLRRRPGELTGKVLRWPAAGHCLVADAAAPGPQQLHLSYAADDSRLEQRAALQLQLARRYPKAAWLTPFSLVVPQGVGGAKFYAVWLDGATLDGQLWMPTRGDGPLLRLRLSTVLAAPVAPAAAAAAAREALEPELMALAAAWTRDHE